MMKKEEKDKILIDNFRQFINKQISVKVYPKECKTFKKNGNVYFLVDLEERINISNKDYNKLISFSEKYQSFKIAVNGVKTVAIFNYKLHEL